jgi:hypothetical protein
LGVGVVEYPGGLDVAGVDCEDHYFFTSVKS